MTASSVLALEISFCVLLMAPGLQAGPLEPSDHPYRESVRAVHEVEHEVDHAWEVYHRAALGGTVASPRVQVEIEEHLHEARTLITQAQEAAAHGDKRQVEQMIEQVRLHTTQAIESSKEPKK